LDVISVYGSGVLVDVLEEVDVLVVDVVELRVVEVLVLVVDVVVLCDVVVVVGTPVPVRTTANFTAMHGLAALTAMWWSARVPSALSSRLLTWISRWGISELISVSRGVPHTDVTTDW